MLFIQVPKRGHRLPLSKPTSPAVTYDRCNDDSPTSSTSSTSTTEYITETTDPYQVDNETSFYDPPNLCLPKSPEPKQRASSKYSKHTSVPGGGVKTSRSEKVPKSSNKDKTSHVLLQSVSS